MFEKLTFCKYPRYDMGECKSFFILPFCSTTWISFMEGSIGTEKSCGLKDCSNFFFFKFYAACWSIYIRFSEVFWSFLPYFAARRHLVSAQMNFKYSRFMASIRPIFIGSHAYATLWAARRLICALGLLRKHFSTLFLAISDKSWSKLSLRVAILASQCADNRFCDSIHNAALVTSYFSENPVSVLWHCCSVIFFFVILKNYLLELRQGEPGNTVT